jgi:hypothetical protein
MPDQLLTTIHFTDVGHLVDAQESNYRKHRPRPVFVCLDILCTVSTYNNPTIPLWAGENVQSAHLAMWTIDVTLLQNDHAYAPAVALLPANF